MSIPTKILPDGPTVQLDFGFAVEVAPGVQVVPKPRQLKAPITRQGIIKFQPVGNGETYKPVVETYPTTVSFSQWNESLYGCSRKVLRVLIAGGFVQGARISPKILMVELESYLAHRQKMMENPYFWNDADNRKRYMDAAEADRSYLGRKGIEKRRLARKPQERLEPPSGAKT